jgi:hypothetical protein
MAVYTVANGGGNINAGATYVGGVAPSSTDTIDFTATSGQLTINTNFTIAGIDFTNYVNTLTMNATLTVNGNTTFVAAMTISGTSKLIIGATSTITTNGKTFPNSVDFNMSAGSQTVTIADNWTITGSVSFFTNIATFNGNKISVGGSLTNNTNGGTTLFELIGTGTWTSSGFKNSLTINTSGTITISGFVAFNTGTLTYTAGTVVTTGSTLTIAASTTLNTSGIIWNNINFTANSTITLLSDLVSIGTVDHYIGSTITFNNFNFYIGGNISLSNGRVFNGTTKIIFNTSTSQNIYVDGAYAGGIRNNLDINATGTVDINWLSYGGGTLTYIAGNVIFSGYKNLAINASCTLNVSGINWSNIGTSYSVTITLASDLTCENTFNIAIGSLIVNGSTLYCKGSLIFSSGGGGHSVSGTTNIEFTGSASGTWMSNTTNNSWRNNVTINKSGGTLTIGSLLVYNTGTLTYVTGTVTATNSTLLIQASTTLTNIDKCKFKNITITAGVTVTMNKFFSGSPEFKTVIRSTTTTNYTITFTDGVPKKAFHVNIKNATITNRNQLNVINRDGNGGSNLGILFGESGLNGFPLNQYGTDNSYSFTDGFSQGGMNN